MSWWRMNILFVSPLIITSSLITNHSSWKWDYSIWFWLWIFSELRLLKYPSRWLPHWEQNAWVCYTLLWVTKWHLGQGRMFTVYCRPLQDNAFLPLLKRRTSQTNSHNKDSTIWKIIKIFTHLDVLILRRNALRYMGGGAGENVIC